MATAARLEELVSSLIGSCHDLDYYLEEGEELSLEELHYIDSIVQPCNSCGWNFDPWELDDEGLCEKCADD